MGFKKSKVLQPFESTNLWSLSLDLSSFGSNIGFVHSSYGQNITTSVYLGETLFCITICIFGLILFTLLIGNMQVRFRAYSPLCKTSQYRSIVFVFLILIFQLGVKSSLQSMSVRVEEWRVKRRDTEEWMRHRQLPPELQERVRRFVQYKWLATRGVDEESILHSLPTDLRREIQRHLCLALVRRVHTFYLVLPQKMAMY